MSGDLIGVVAGHPIDRLSATDAEPRVDRSRTGVGWRVGARSGRRRLVSRTAPRARCRSVVTAPPVLRLPGQSRYRSSHPRCGRRRRRGRCPPRNASSQSSSSHERMTAPLFQTDATDSRSRSYRPRGATRTLAVGLHQRVLDAVVNHLHVVARPRRPHPFVAVGAGGDGVERRLEFLVGPLGSADHQENPSSAPAGPPEVPQSRYAAEQASARRTESSK